MAKNYTEGSANCVGAQEALGGTCCREVPGESPLVGSVSSLVSSPTTSGKVSSPNWKQQQVSTSTTTDDGSPTSTTKIAVTVALKDDPEMSALASTVAEPEYPSSTHYCRTTMEQTGIEVDIWMRLRSIEAHRMGIHPTMSPIYPRHDVAVLAPPVATSTSTIVYGMVGRLDFTKN